MAGFVYFCPAFIPHFSVLRMFSLSCYCVWFCLFFYFSPPPVFSLLQEMSHILAQKQLRSIILSVSSSQQSIFIYRIVTLEYNHLTQTMCTGCCNKPYSRRISTWAVCYMWCHVGYCLLYSLHHTYSLFHFPSALLISLMLWLLILNHQLLHFFFFVIRHCFLTKSASWICYAPLNSVLCLFLTALLIPYLSSTSRRTLSGASYLLMMRWPTSSMCCRCSLSTCWRIAWWPRWTHKTRCRKSAHSLQDWQSS